MTARIVTAFSMGMFGLSTFGADSPTRVFIEKHCAECHDAETKKGNLDLTSLKPDFADAENFARLVKIHDRIESGEMPPPKKPRPTAKETAAMTKWLRTSLVDAEQKKLAGEGRTGLRRLDALCAPLRFRSELPRQERTPSDTGRGLL